MKTTIEFMLAVQKKENLKTPYAIAKFLGISPTSLYRYMDGSQTMDDYTSLKVAKALGVDPMGVIAAANAERAKTEEERKDWTEIVKKVGGRAAAIIITAAALMIGVGSPSPAYAGTKFHDHCLLCKILDAQFSGTTSLRHQPKRHQPN